MNIINEIHAYLAQDIASINRIIINHLEDKDILINSIGQHLITAGGKRIRPIMTILISKMFSSSGINNLKLATAVEFIHAATLLHDDVVDNSSVRRFQPTANFIWGNKASILVGDFLLSQSFKLMIETGVMPALKSLSSASANLIEGEVRQLGILQKAQMITQGQYEAIITAKTAELFASACEIGGILANKPENICQILKEFGLVIGKIFQITDDLLDYLGTKELIGKNIGDDFLEGKVTMPLILLYDQLPKLQKRELEEIIKKQERSMDEFTVIRNLLKQYKIEEQILEYLIKLKVQAYELLEQVEPDVEDCKNYLVSLVDFTINRVY